MQEAYSGDNVHFVYGELSSSDLIEKAASEADIVIRKSTLSAPGSITADTNQPTDTAESSDDVPSAKAIAKGLSAGHSAEKPGYWIHICGTAILGWVRHPL